MFQWQHSVRSSACLLAVLLAACGGASPGEIRDGSGGGIDARADGTGLDASLGDGADTGADTGTDRDASGGGDGDGAGDGGSTGEVCGNGLDDNHDGRVDEGCSCLPGAMQRCFGDDPALAGIGACVYGTQRCAGDGEFGSWGPCTGAGAPGGEICDGVDNDCDGRVDNGCDCHAGDTRGCYTGPAATRGIGACHDGTETCGAGAGGVGSAWGRCVGDAVPSTEICDGIDNDCDGTVDNGCACTPGATRTCYGGPDGTQGVGPCRAGTQTCASGSSGPAWGMCAMQVLPGAEVCDGIDNDCDGTVDNGCACMLGATRGCYDGPMGTRAIGLCADGTQTCVAGPMGVGSVWGTCTGEHLPSMEVCDGLDNNCNGTVDDGCACRSGQSRGCYDGPAGTQNVGPCRAGLQACVVSGGAASWGACTGEQVPAVDVCNGMDDDCNGVVDDGCLCTPGATRSCYPGTSGTPGVGVCQAGLQTCTAGPGGVGSVWGVCTGYVLPGAESCNGIDDNCDGMIDEGCACSSGATRSCYGGPMGTQGVGPCRAGSQSCVISGGVASWGMCAGDVLPAAEACNGVDDDCNGVVDNGCACSPGAAQACYTGPAGTQGVGACHAGSQQCVAGAGGVGSAWGACGGQAVPSAESCNGIDDDCNGVVDDSAACGPTVTCPAPATAPAGSTVTLTATPSAGATSFAWTVTSSPAGSTWTLGSPSLPTTTFTSVIVGTYTLQFTATDAMGRSASCTTTVTMTAHGLRVEMFWNTSGDDVDLHLHDAAATTWFSTPQDCYYADRTPSWDTASTADDPSLDVDDVDGLGPENIRVDSPVTSETYTVGVHYYSDHSTGNTPSVTVRIYCGGALAVPAFTRVLHTNTDDNDFWRVARVRFTSPSACTVTTVNDVITGNTARAGSP